MKIHTPMRAKILWIFVAILFCISHASCLPGPTSSGSIDAFIARISEAILSSEQNVMLVRAFSRKENDALIHDIPFEEYMQMSNTGHVLTGFQVIDSLNPSTKMISSWAKDGIKIATTPEGFSGTFSPKHGSEWLIIAIEDKVRLTKSVELSYIILADEGNGILSAKSDNRFGINVARFLADLKAIKNAILTKKAIKSSDLRTNAGRLVFEKVML